MAAPSVRTLAADQRVLGVLTDGPQTAREIARLLHLEELVSWERELGIEVAWFTDEEPVGARLLATCSAEERGLVHLQSWELHNRLASMEKRGLVQRIQIPGHRPMLWRLP